MRIRFADMEKWAYHLDLCCTWMSQRYAHLDWFYKLRDGGVETLVVLSGAAQVDGVEWWFQQVVGSCLTSDEEKWMRLAASAQQQRDAVAHALGQSGIQVLEGWPEELEV